MNQAEIKWNDKVKLILSDVDETLVDLYLPAEQITIDSLTRILKEGRSLFLITGQGLKSLMWRIIDQLPKELRKHILIADCSGAQVWGFNPEGIIKDKPYYSIYESAMTPEQKAKWREVVSQLVKEFNLETYDTMPVEDFKKKYHNPRAVMLEDRGPQITFEVVNGHNLTQAQAIELGITSANFHDHYDFRVPIAKRADELFRELNLPITPRLAGEFALDFALKGVNKTTAVKKVLEDENILATLGLTKGDLENPETMEIWGDKFSTIRGGTDRHICEAVPKEVRSIDFRQENPVEFLPGYNIVVWNGNHHLHLGLQEYLQSRDE